MSTVRLAGALVIVAFVVGACLPASVRPSETSSPLGETPAPDADLCGQLAQVYAERNALAEVFRLVIENKLAQAIPAASAIRERLDTLLADLPPERGLAEPMTSLRGVVEASAQVVQGTAEVVEDPRRPTPDRQLMLVEGETVVTATDAVFSMREPGDTVRRACPGLADAPAPVAFPPRPTVADFGLPGRAGRLVLDAAHLRRLGASTSDVIVRLGGDPDRGREIEVEATFAEGGQLWLRVYEGVSVDPSTLASAIATGLYGSKVKPVERRIAGFRVIAFANRDDPSGSMHFASRGDRILEMSGFSDADVVSLLAAMP